MGRSGTTMLTSMLNMNEQIIATPENEFVLFSYSSFKNKDFNNPDVRRAFSKIFHYNFNRVINIWMPGSIERKITNLTDKKFANVCKQMYLSYPLAQKNIESVKWVVDKNPSYSLYMNTLHELYPKAKYILIVRDYRDNILSRKKYSDKGSSIFELAASWNYYYYKIFKSAAKYDLPIFIVKYENLVEFPEKTLREMCCFLEVQYTDEMLQFQGFASKIKDHAKTKLSTDNFRKISEMHSNLNKNVNTERIEAFRKELSTDEINILDTLCKKNAKVFNYKPSEEFSLGISFGKKLFYLFALLKVIIFNQINIFYYKMPVSFRLLFKEKLV